MVTLKDILVAQKNVTAYAKWTPLQECRFLSDLCNAKVYLKLENQQITHSFKVRGVLNKLLHLSPEEKKRGVATASAGNHGQAVAFGAKELNFHATIVEPTNTPQVKIDGIKRFGAELILDGATYPESEKIAKEIAKKEKRLYISPYNDELIVAGHGTIGLEIIKDLPNTDTIIVPVGGGGMISGISIAAKSLMPQVKVLGVQSEAVPIMYESLKDGKIVPPHRHEPQTIAEGLSGGVEEGSITFPIIRCWVDEVFLVKEKTIRHAVFLLWKNEQVMVEGSAAAAVALMLENKARFAGQTVALVISGGNIDEAAFQNILAEESA
jgi:threonine dehydratase